MNPERRQRAAPMVIFALTVSLPGCAERPSAEALARCEVIGSGRLSGGGVTLRVGGFWPNGVTSGRVPGCGEQALATRVFLEVHDAKHSIPPALQPRSPVTVVLDPELPASAPLERVEASVEHGAVLVRSSAANSLNRAVYLHELAHLSLSGPRPTGPLAGRLLAAVEEGVADYFAAILTASPVVGPSSASRNLGRMPRGTEALFSTLALPGFDPHSLGSVFGAALWRAEPRSGPLLQDLVSCLRDMSDLSGIPDAPRAVFNALRSGCPARSRPALTRALAAAVPSELWPGDPAKISVGGDTP